MIDVKELRIGNLLFEKYWDNSKGKFEYSVITVAGINKTSIVCENDSIYNLDDLQPIPLSEEILLKCGFRKTKSGTFIHDTNAFRLVFESFECCFVDGVGIDMKHLHQLQNLHFTLYNEELEINLENIC